MRGERWDAPFVPQEELKRAPYNWCNRTANHDNIKAQEIWLTFERMRHLRFG
jgi:hypothetical protein